MHMILVVERQFVLLPELDLHESIDSSSGGTDVLMEPEIPMLLNTTIAKDICSVFDCLSTSQPNSSIKFYPLPSCSNNMPAAYQHIERKRRDAWLDTISFKEIKPNCALKLQICGKHFHCGKLENMCLEC